MMRYFFVWKQGPHSRMMIVSMNEWVIYAFLAALAAAVVGVFSKIGVVGVDPTVATTIRGITIALTMGVVGRHPVHRLTNPFRPSGLSSVTSMPVTSARGGPIRHHDTHRATDSIGPSNTASTVPSERLRTQPVTPASRAWCTHESRYHTPCTSPRTTTRARTIALSLLQPDVLDPHAPRAPVDG